MSTNTLQPLPERIMYCAPTDIKEELRTIALKSGRSLSSLTLFIVTDYLEKEREKKEKM